VSASKDQNIKIWSLEQPNSDSIHTIYTGGDITSLSIYNYFVFAGSLTGNIKAWDLKTGRLVQDLQDCKSTIFELCTVGDLLLSGCRDHYINVFNTNTLEFVQKLEPPHYDSVSAFCAPSGGQLYSVSRDKSIKLWSIRSTTSVDNPSQPNI